MSSGLEATVTRLPMKRPIEEQAKLLMMEHPLYMLGHVIDGGRTPPTLLFERSL
jgi:hypothetical protein